MFQVFNKNTEFLVDIATNDWYVATVVPLEHKTQYQAATSSTTRFLSEGGMAYYLTSLIVL